MSLFHCFSLSEQEEVASQKCVQFGTVFDHLVQALEAGYFVDYRKCMKILETSALLLLYIPLWGRASRHMVVVVCVCVFVCICVCECVLDKQIKLSTENCDASITCFFDAG